MNEVWTQWEGQVVDGAFLLRRFLCASDHSAVFLTECRAQNSPNAAIKIVPADPATADVKLSGWRTAAALSHPHLIRILDSGRYQLEDQQYLYVVMEYAGETLAEVLPSRALTQDEVREMLGPTLDALAFLHRQNMVHGHFKPSNILVVDDQPKLSSDTISAAGQFLASLARSSPYDAPETREGEFSAAADIWAVGVTIVEALTQRAPAGPVETSATFSLLGGLPPIFVDAVRRCLSRNPADRPTVSVLQASSQTQDALHSPILPVPLPEVVRTVAPVISHPKPSIRRLPFKAVGVLAIVLIASVWLAWRGTRSDPNSEPAGLRTTAATFEQAASAPSSSSANAAPSSAAIPHAASRRSDRSAQTAADASSVVLHEELPDVSRSASNSIRGRFDISVLVTVDKSGNVVNATLEKSGPSQYFARAAAAASRKWKFAPAEGQDSREWLLQFEFTRGKTIAQATIPRP
jgi:TonB family protein